MLRRALSSMDRFETAQFRRYSFQNIEYRYSWNRVEKEGIYVYMGSLEEIKRNSSFRVTLCRLYTFVEGVDYTRRSESETLTARRSIHSARNRQTGEKNSEAASPLPSSLPWARKGDTIRFSGLTTSHRGSIRWWIWGDTEGGNEGAAGKRRATYDFATSISPIFLFFPPCY